MSQYNSLKATIDANVKQNGVQAITGQILNSVLNAMVNTLGAGYQFAGVATTATSPGSPDAKVFYIANGKGTYTNFGGLQVTEDDVVVLYWDSSWHKVSTGIASQERLEELVGVVDDLGGKVSVAIATEGGDDFLVSSKMYDGKYIKGGSNPAVTNNQAYGVYVFKVFKDKTYSIYWNSTAAIAGYCYFLQTDELDTANLSLVLGSGTSAQVSGTYTPDEDGYIFLSCDKSSYASTSSNYLIGVRGYVEKVIAKGESDIYDRTVIPYGEDVYMYDGYINSSTGASTSTSTYTRTDFIRIPFGVESILVKKVGGSSAVAGLFFYDAEYNPILTGYVGASKGTFKVESSDIPVGAVYFRSSSIKTGVTDVSGIVIYYSSNRILLNSENIDKLQEKVSKIPEFIIERTNNIVTLESFITEGYWRDMARGLLVDASFRTTDFIKVDPNTTYYIRPIGFMSVATFDETKTLRKVDYNIASSSSVKTLTTMGYASYIQVSAAGLHVKEVCISKEELTEYSEGENPVVGLYGERLRAIPARYYSVKNRWKGSKYLSLGDSVTYRNHWQKVLDFYLGTSHTDLAHSGMTMGGFAFTYSDGGSESAGGIESGNANGLVSSDTANAHDAILVCGYANNVSSNNGMGTQMGTINDDFIRLDDALVGTTYPTYQAFRIAVCGQTFYAQCKSTFEYLQRIAPKIEIIGVGQLQMSRDMKPEGQADAPVVTTIDMKKRNYWGKSCRDYSDAMKEVCEYYGIKFIDLEREGGVSQNNYINFYGGDTVHPNFLEYFGGDDYPMSGMQRMAKVIASEIVG